MNVLKEYNTAKKQKGNVCFGSIHGGRWVFRCSDKESGPLEKILKVPGGREVAEKIAVAIEKSWKRTAGKQKEAPDRLDTACRNAIDKLCQIRTLKDWGEEPEWWTNALVEGMESAPMKYVKQSKPIAAGVAAEDLAPVVEAHVRADEVLHEAFAQAEPVLA